MTKYIALLQLKGGAGKTTIAANLCGFFLGQDKSVLTVDADMPQGTLSAWAALSPENEKHEHVSVSNAEELLNVLQQAEGEFDIVIVDAPPRLADMMKAILFVSDLVLLPLAPTSPDIWSTSDMLPMIQEAEREKPLNLRLVFNKFKPTNRAKEIRDQAIEALGLPQINTALSDYVAYPDVVGIGSHVLKHNHPKAKAQFLDFANEVLQALE